MKETVGVIGLGIMGGAMAEALLEHGYNVVGYDVVPGARHRLKQAGGKHLASSTAVAERADVLITALATVAALDDAVERIAAAKRAKGARRPIVVETSTLPLEDKERALIRLRRAGMTLLDCPISGTAVRMKARGPCLSAAALRPANAFARCSRCSRATRRTSAGSATAPR